MGQDASGEVEDEDAFDDGPEEGDGNDGSGEGDGDDGSGEGDGDDGPGDGEGDDGPEDGEGDDGPGEGHGGGDPGAGGAISAGSANSNGDGAAPVIDLEVEVVKGELEAAATGSTPGVAATGSTPGVAATGSAAEVANAGMAEEVAPPTATGTGDCNFNGIFILDSWDRGKEFSCRPILEQAIAFRLQRSSKLPEKDSQRYFARLKISKLMCFCFKQGPNKHFAAKVFFQWKICTSG